ncbi:hypothetical protein PC9H_000813 [Pleurotus ostreatus]|uniref:UEV-domain-containing protein n=1 Tax=Pleurotus ostreatus TaxID=5322 RepID=A0A8H7DY49_PLEOS|nr:uncharacterized protein PC9H_000813 [Pleurotus ostreatus]KAF7440468.1 hypothetical protein PC9H_000813 [Pleurotus ostreatus]
MSATNSQSLIRRWLVENVQLYAQRDRVLADIEAVLARFHTIRPKSDEHTFDDGRTQILLCLHGLLPITYRQASYNIQISVWINRDYPRHPPIAYVVPTSDMFVKAGKFVDVSGRCNLEYMQQWERKSEGCSILALLEAMQDQFSREPPMYAKPKQNPAGMSSVPAQPPPLPASPQSSVPNPHDRPALPPKPGSSIGPSLVNQPTQPLPYSPNVKATPSSSINSLPSSSTSSPPPIPPRSNLPQYHHNHAGYQTIPPTYRPPTTVPETTNVNVPPVHQNRDASPSSGSVSPPPVPPLPPQLPHQPVYAQSPPQPPLSIAVQAPTIVPHTSIPPPNLLDEDNDTGPFTSAGPPPSATPTGIPPRPPNPELLRLHAQVHQKLTSELASLTQALSLDAERLRAHQSDLLAGEPAIRDEMARLEAVKDVCQNVAGRLRDSVEQAERNVTELRRKEDPEVDELVCSTTIVHNQLINLVAEDNAIEDTIYHLHRALNAGRIDLDRFLRTTRILAEEQFMKRALVEKIQNGIPMGPPTGSSW